MTDNDFPSAGHDVPATDNGEREVVPLSTVDDLTGSDRRNLLDGLEGIPATNRVGLIDASTDASTQTANVLIDESCDLALDTFVVSAQRLVDGSVLFHYGIISEVSGRIEGAEMTTDTARFAAATLPGQRFRRAEVTWIRTHPEKYLPPASGSPIWIAEDLHRRRALFVDKMDANEAIPIGLDMNNQPVFLPYSFLNGDRGAHASISGKSGVATKTSYALFLLYMLFETNNGVTARAGNPHDRALLFSVKGSDLCVIDKANNRFHADDEMGAEAMDQWEALIGTRNPAPFSDVGVFAPAQDAAPGAEAVAEISVRDRRDTHAYGWSPASFVTQGLLEFVFDDLESGQLSFIEQVVRLQLLRWAWPLAGDTQGRIVLANPDLQPGDPVPSTWESASRHWRTVKRDGLPAGDGLVVTSLDDIVEFVADRVLDSSAAFDPAWVGGVSQGTCQAFVRRLWKSTPRLRRLIRAGLTEVELEQQVSVIDVHVLHTDAQRFVVAAVLARVWSQHENSTAPGRTFVVLDELNKYAPRNSSSPIKSLLVDVAARGRSLGVILIGAQQNPSGVDRDITNNAALEVVGQIKASEASELGFLPPTMRARAQIIAPGTMITNQPLLPAPVPIRFPYPPYATRYAEVLGGADDAERAESLLDGM
ncbi:ATP-binding protein [Ilumatobacter coccineus]|uniref:ATP-binding protein n=1 Tax=Ilumatobacter coccineus (strain NBRC 103263 / KCTC 29153 / YM16-304) TaxID=1313172 RepID=A0A6C7EC96_ILUCY|nr:ATP-binding protein [Ilumatobacter coccineus]BAN04387.1 hypothetical protein YM304_40730 [Ilumatobacter coccineus YM16-304]